MITRRTLLAGGAAIGLSACVRAQTETPPPAPPPMPDRYQALLDEPYPVLAVPNGIVDPRLWRQEVANPFPDHAEGTVIVDPDAAYLHLVGVNGKAMRYGVGVGAAGYDWNGQAVVQYRQRWPRWKAPDTMIARRPEFAPYSVRNGGMPPGPGNPLGARALYLFQHGRDTLYRIHGACEPKYLGKAVSSGCIRLLDQDIIDLHDRVRDGAPVIVLSSLKPEGLQSLY